MGSDAVPAFRGMAHAIRMANSVAGRRWAVESMTLESVPAGVQR